MKLRLNGQDTLLLAWPRVLDYVALTKPDLTFLSVVTAVGGGMLASGGIISYPVLLHTLMGTVLAGAGAGALNQYIECSHDSLMRRTVHRPLPAGRLRPAEALVFGLMLSVVGIVELAAFTTLLAGLLCTVTIVTYLFLYTPLKRLTPLATLVGAVTGALPPVIGWAAVRGELSAEAFVLFGILFFWQVPHFLSLAWMYRLDYARAGYRLLTVLDGDGKRTSRTILMYMAVLLPTSLLPVMLGQVGLVYLIGTVLSGALFLVMGLRFAAFRTSAVARQVFTASLLYLPALLLLMLIERL